MNAIVSRSNAILAGKGLLLLLWSGMVLGADLRADPSSISGKTWALLLATCFVGYLMSSAEMLFGWLEEKGAKAFGRVVQTFAMSMGAGILAFLAAWSADLAPVYWYIAALPASFAGETYMRKFVDKQSAADADRSLPGTKGP